MLRKAILIAAAFALISPLSALAQDLPNSVNEKYLKTEVRKVNNFNKNKLIKASQNQGQMKVEDKDAPTETSADKIYVNKGSYEIFEKPESSFTITDVCPIEVHFVNVVQVNSHQILIESNKFEGQLMLQILDSEGNIVFNQLISVHSNIYFNVDFLKPGNYLGTLSGVGVNSKFNITK